MKLVHALYCTLGLGISQIRKVHVYDLGSLLVY